MCLLSLVAWCLVLARLKQVQALQESEVFDVLVIGGGVTGCGVALDSVTRGESVKKCTDPWPDQRITTVDSSATGIKMEGYFGMHDYMHVCTSVYGS